MTNNTPLFLLLIKKELLLAYRHPREACVPILFFILVIILFPLAILPKPELLQAIAPGVFWIAALFSILLSFERLFHADYHDGSLEQLLFSSSPLSLLILGKMFAHWLVTGLPLVIIAPFMGFTFHLTSQCVWILFFSLALGTPTLSLLGAMLSALTIKVKNNGMLLTLLLLPLYIPVLIFGSSAIAFALAGFPAKGPLAFLGALLILSMTLAPLATANILKMVIR